MEFQACLLQKSDDERLTLFLNKLSENFEQVLGYHYPFYRDALEITGVGDPMYIAIIDKQQEIFAVLPGFTKTQNEGTVYSSLPFFGPNSGILYDFGSNNGSTFYALIFDFLFKELSKFNMLSASFYTPFNSNGEIDQFKQVLPDAISIDKFTSFIPLQDFELANEWVDSSALRNIRKAQKSGVTIRTEVNAEDIDTIYSIYLQNCKDYSIPIKPKEIVQFLLTEVKAKEHVKTYIAEHEGKIIGALLMICSQQTASYYIPCNVHEYRNFQPNALLIASALEDAKKTGRKFWNWESSPSKESGVYQFKKKWGSVDSHYAIFVKPFKDKVYLTGLGQSAIGKLYPYFFVYPFNLIET